MSDLVSRRVNAQGAPRSGAPASCPGREPTVTARSTGGPFLDGARRCLWRPLRGCTLRLYRLQRPQQVELPLWIALDERGPRDREPLARPLPHDGHAVGVEREGVGLPLDQDFALDRLVECGDHLRIYGGPGATATGPVRAPSRTAGRTSRRTRARRSRRPDTPAC